MLHKNEGYVIDNKLDRGLEIYERFVSGDEDALEELIGLYRDGLTLFINGIVHDIFYAEELMIDTFARFALKGKQFEGRSSMKTYLYSIGRNLAFRHLKKNRHNSHDQLDESHTVSVNATAPDNPEAEYFQKEESKQLYAAMQKLKPEYRQTLYLLYFEDMSYAEAGKILHKTTKQISDLAYRGKASLRIKFEKGMSNYEK